ncbi:glutamine amidotransferase class-I [Parvibaculum lavamentivorans DS-1]|uniref:Glutamine amidotransferase class-I n=1 Tax=Parvibaculum lavamentivorans (strain DS-1 / DSM 13023 / NCIMB 13966) TaxID=402881 RepID=A7HQE2_PARL1|nr:type 1 glutamine amidotransferase [Parvibaculum lavamentivorans]ABS62125.1 glutamine amidotransferase class-I [Parvibaculum lavamentivorans DS-1]
MHILYLVNALDSPPGVLLEEAALLGASATQIDTVNGRDMETGEARAVPEAAAGYDALVVLGGVMGVYEAGKYPFIEESKRLVRRFHDEGKPVMGVCLGSQIVASAFGAPVYKMSEKLEAHEEWGFVPQTWEAAVADDPLLHDAAPGLRTMHWHGDTFDLPEGATRLATRETCPNQAFRMGGRTYAFQFHLEVTRGILDGWTTLRAKALNVSRPTIEKLIGPQIEEALRPQEAFARQTMRRWMALCR